MLAAALFVFAAMPNSHAQESDSRDQQKQIADRFLQVLLRRPRPGTALDRVYGYHIQAGTLDEFVDELVSGAESEEGAARGTRYMLAGLVQLQRGNDAEAAQQFKRAEPLLPDDAQVSFYLGKSLQMIGRTDEAAHAYERAIERKPLRNEALPIFSQLGRIYQRAQQTEKALSVWTRLEAMFPGDLRVSEEIAQTLAEEGQLDAALERYEKLVQRAQRDDPSSYRSIGYAIEAAEIKRSLGRTEQSTSDLESLLTRLRPGSWLHSDVRRRIEAGFLRSGDYGALADYYRESLEKQPDDLDVRLRLGRTLAKAGRLKDAVATLEKAIELAPESIDARLGLIQILRTSGQPGAAAEQFQALAEQDSDNPDYLVQWGNLLLEDGSRSREQRQDAAAKVWERLVDSRADDALILAQAADLFRNIERNDRAIELYEKSVGLAPDQPQYREYLGEFLHQLGRKDEALEVWAGLAEGDRRTRQNLIRLAEVYSTFEYPDEALKSFAAAAEMDPTLPERLRFAELLARSEKFDEALGQLDLALEIAQTPEERDQVLRARIGVYGRSGELQERIAETRKETESDEASVGAFRRLALMLDANSQLPDAIAAIRMAIEKSPRDPELLAIAASLYEKSSLLNDAVDSFRQLADLDTRYQSSYLKRIAQLQMRLGRIDEALATSRQLIAISPGNPDPYRTHSDFCFQAGREEEGLETLRRALRIAPRDRDCRVALASALAERFRTDEAIELYWQQFAAGEDLEDQLGVVESLAPLYDRKSDLPRLISRLEENGREKSNARSATVLIATAFKSVGDFGGAKDRLEPLLADNPNDIDVLEQLVALCDAMGEPEQAIAFQKQILGQAETSENRVKYVRLLVETGQIDQVDAALQRLGNDLDPKMAVRLIDGALNKRDIDAAIRIGREVLRRRADLWEVELRLAYALAFNQDYDEALERAERIRTLDLPLDTVPESAKQPPQGARSSQAGAINAQISRNRQYWAQSGYQIGQTLRVGRYANYYYNSPARISAPSMPSFGVARATALGLTLAVAGKQDRLEQAYEAFVPKGFLESDASVDEFWDAYHASVYHVAFGPENSTPTQDPLATEQYKIAWKLAEKGSVEDAMPLLSALRSRIQRNQQLETKSEPLPDEQLDRLESIGAKLDWKTQGVYLLAAIKDELRRGSREEAAAKIDDRLPQDDSLETLTVRIQYAVATQDEQAVQDAVNALQETLKSDRDQLSVQGLQRATQALSSATAVIKSDSLRRDLLKSVVAAEAQDLAKNRRRRNSRSQTGRVSIHRRVSNVYRSTTIQAPLSNQLANQAFIQRVYNLLVPENEEDVSEELLAYLDDGNAESLTAEERKLRQLIVAFAHWWDNDLDAAYDRIKRLAAEFPSDIDLQIESARLAAELKRPRESLEALDSFEPLDQQTLQVRELAAMNLATQLGEFDRAKEAAKRLFGLRFEPRNATRIGGPDAAIGFTGHGESRLEPDSSPREQRFQHDVANGQFLFAKR